MSEREDIEALAELLWSVDGEYSDVACEMVLKSDWLAAHVEAVRVSERVRLAGEAEARAAAWDEGFFAGETNFAVEEGYPPPASGVPSSENPYRSEPNPEAQPRTCEVCAQAAVSTSTVDLCPEHLSEFQEWRALVPVPGVRLTEEE